MRLLQTCLSDYLALTSPYVKGERHLYDIARPVFIQLTIAESVKLERLRDDKGSRPASGVASLGLGEAPAGAKHLVENRATVSGLALGLVVLERPSAGDGIRRPRGNAIDEDSRPRDASIRRVVDRPRSRRLVDREARVARIEQAGLEADRRNTAPGRSSRSTSEVAAEALEESVRLSAKASAEDRPSAELAELIELNEVKGHQSLGLSGLSSARSTEVVQDLEVIDSRARVGARTVGVTIGIIGVGNDLVLRSTRREVEVSIVTRLRLISTPEERLANRILVRGIAGVAVKEHALDLAGRGDAVVGRAVLSADAVSSDLRGLAVNKLHRSLEVIRTARIDRSRNRVAETTKRRNASHSRRRSNHEFLHFVFFLFFGVGLVGPFPGTFSFLRLLQSPDCLHPQSTSGG